MTKFFKKLKDKQIHNPVSNGWTKALILVSMIALFVLGVLSLTFSLKSISGVSGISAYFVKSIFGTCAIACIGGLVYAIKSFFDTREAEQRHKDKIAKLDKKLNFKIQKLKLKRERRKNG